MMDTCQKQQGQAHRHAGMTQGGTRLALGVGFLRSNRRTREFFFNRLDKPFEGKIPGEGAAVNKEHGGSADPEFSPFLKVLLHHRLVYPL